VRIRLVILALGKKDKGILLQNRMKMT